MQMHYSGKDQCAGKLLPVNLQFDYGLDSIHVNLIHLRKLYCSSCKALVAVILKNYET